MRAQITKSGDLYIAQPAFNMTPVAIRCPFQREIRATGEFVNCNAACSLFDIQLCGPSDGRIYLRCGTGRTFICDVIEIEFGKKEKSK